MAKILVAEDDITSLTLLSRTLREAGHEVVGAQDGLQAMRLLSSEIELALFDLDLPKASGFECMSFVKREYPGIPIIVVSGASIDDAVKTMKQGAYWFIPKPIDKSKVLEIVRGALEHAASFEFTGFGRPNSAGLAPAFVGTSPAIRRIREEVLKIGENDSPVLISGEEGTGKTVLAQLIHRGSARANQPFVSVCCASLPEDQLELELFGNEARNGNSAHIGRIEMANGGTLFLDKIDELSVDLQARITELLRDGTYFPHGKTESRRVNIRIITTSTKDLEKLVNAGIFSRDLFYRLKVISFFLPPLRDRLEDMPVLIEHLLEKIALRRQSKRAGISPEAVRLLNGLKWDGNLRELENVLERATAFLSGDTIDVADLVSEEDVPVVENHRQQLFLGGLPLEEIEKRAVVETLKLCGGNKAATARKLGISERSIYNKLKRFNISA